MLHGPCDVNNPQAKCMVNGKCSKHFPKEYRERTDWAEDSYSLYARPDNGLVFECNGARFTNQYVVPYCPQLLLLFDYHINVEISAGLGTVKYLVLYCLKLWAYSSTIFNALVWSTEFPFLGVKYHTCHTCHTLFLSPGQGHTLVLPWSTSFGIGPFLEYSIWV